MVFEEELMKEYKLKYNKSETERRVSQTRIPAGIENIIKTERPELNKLLNLQTKVSHGKMIVVHGRVEKSSSRPNGIKRKKGLFYGEFIKYHNGKIVHQMDETRTTNVSATTESQEKKKMQHKKVVMDNKEIQSGRKILDMAIKDQSRKRDAEQLDEVQAIKDKNNRKKKKTKKQKNSTPDNDSISTIKSDDPEIIKRRKAKIRRNKERIDSLGLGKNKKASKKKEKNNIIKPVSEEIIEIIQHKKFQNGKIKIKVKWDNGETEWCDNIDAVKKEFPDLVKKYFNTFPDINKVDDDSDEESYACPIDHEEFNIGITYKEEPNYLYWSTNQSMEGVLCSNCQGDFTSETCKPTNKYPAFTCMKRPKGCNICYCYKCFHKKMDNNNNNGSCRMLKRRRIKQYHYFLLLTCIKISVLNIFYSPVKITV